MTEALPNNSSYDNQQGTQVLFKKSLFGFKCDEVLNHIERLSASAALEASRATAELSSKTNEVSLMRQKVVDIENQINEQKLLLVQESARADIAEQSIDEMRTRLQELTQIADENAQKIAAEELRANENEQKIAAEQSRANESEQNVAILRNNLSEVEFEAEELRDRIYNATQENNLLKADNASLNDTINKLTQAVSDYENRQSIIAVQDANINSDAEKILAQANIDAINLRTQASADAASVRAQVNAEMADLRMQARQEADIILQEANSNALAAKRDAAQIAAQERDKLITDARVTKEHAESAAKAALSDANEQAQRILLDAQRDENMKKVLLQGSCEDIAESVAILRKELNDVDAKILSASLQMQNASKGISTALELAEKNLDILDIRVKTFPEEHSAKNIYHDAKTFESSIVKKQKMPIKRSKISEGILDALNRILG